MGEIGTSAADRPRNQEIINALTHGVGCVVGLVAGTYVLLFVQTSATKAFLAFTVYLVSLVTLYCFSALSHGCFDHRRDRFRAWDQGAIYLLIAGTYTPFICVDLSTSGQVALLVAIWVAALIGFYSKVFAQFQINSVSTVTYLLLGWLPAFPLSGHVSADCFRWITIGGVCYSIGVVFLLLDRKIHFFHTIWHLWVMVASACHFYGIVRHAL